MRWDEGHRSNDVIDRRGAPSGGGGGGGLLWMLMWIGSRFGLKGILVALLAFGAISYFQAGTGGPGVADGGGASDETRTASLDDEAAAFVGFVLDDVQDTWTRKRAEQGQAYDRAKLVLFTERTHTGCGTGHAVTGPFYCPADHRAYLDLSFFRELDRRLGAAGDFAQAYVIAHEIGHHVQSLTGASSRVHRAPGREQDGPGGLKVRLELQADCYAGVWAHETSQRALLEAGDLNEALTAAQAIGDDTLQRNAGQAVRPESFTHGTSEQRQRWFKRGFDTGDPEACDTFGAVGL